jgi:hypothetical protein
MELLACVASKLYDRGLNAIKPDGFHHIPSKTLVLRGLHDKVVGDPLRFDFCRCLLRFAGLRDGTAGRPPGTRARDRS